MTAPIALPDARARVLAEVVALGPQSVALGDALGRVLAEEVHSPGDVPAFDNSAMDGYALRADDVAGASEARPATLVLAGESRAGAPAAVELGPGEAFRISTGAALPDGADAVVRQEDAEADVGAGTVRVRAAVAPGRDVRRAGEDMRRGALVLGRGAVLGPAELGVLASAGHAEVSCARRPRVHVVTTGDELVAPDAPLLPGSVRDANAVTVPAQARAAGAQVAVTAAVADRAEPTRAAIGAALASADVLVVCGGVSVGPHDHVKAAFAALGVQERFWRVALRPGKPTWFGVHEDRRRRTLVFGLPGNPVSAMVTFQLFVRPVLRALQGASTPAPTLEATLDGELPATPGRAHAVRCRAEARADGWHAVPTGPQGSHVLTSMLSANALVVVEAGRGPLAAGERVALELLDR